MKLIVFGDRGQLGQELTRQCPGEIEFVGLDIDRIDISDAQAVNDFVAHERPDVVINAAAYTAVDAAEENHETAFKANAIGPGLIANACTDANSLFFHISTDYVFDGKKEGAYREDDMPNPLGVYGKSKLEGEQAVIQNCREHYIIRTAWFYSAHGKNFVKTMLGLAQERHELGVVADQFGGPTSANDLASTIYTMIDRHSQLDNKGYGTYHFSGDERISWYDFAKEIFTMAESELAHQIKVKPITTDEYPTPAKRPINSFMDCSKIEAFLGTNRPEWRDSLNVVLAQLSSGSPS